MGFEQLLKELAEGVEVHDSSSELVLKSSDSQLNVDFFERNKLSDFLNHA